ncbi:peptidase associated/transthyretin-like domain-containing protein [Actinomadura logoneensis]|uniref:carboxypeptidase-like regulatory domain-containing protein n=1 Tax=Actinomadura logoneensis TaxID=2293572 RepID=UPI0011C0EAFD|nr:carboxypeptidase-like regulatory domain-containing protein [Actinomadura logoneensis]
MTKTRVADFRASRDQVDADHDEVTFTGRVVTDEATPRPVGDALVVVRCMRGCDNFLEVGRVHADAEGRFSLSGHLKSAGSYAAQYASSQPTRYNDGWSPLLKITAGAKAPAIVTLDPPSARVLGYGTKFAYTGRVRRQDGRPVAGVGVIVTECRNGDLCYTGTVRTDPDGRFRSNAVAVAPSVVDAALFSDLYSVARVPTIRYDVRYETRVTDMNVRLEQNSSGWVEADIRIQRKTTRWEPDAGLYNAVALYFRPKGGTTWTRQNGCGVSDDDGWIRRCVAPSPGDGDWQARVALTDSTRPSVSVPRALTMRYPTRFDMFDAAPEPVRKGGTVKLSGYLYWMKPDGRGSLGLPKALGKRKIAFYFQARGSKTWSRLGSGTTSRYGWFSSRFTARRDGTWRVAFAGDGRLLATSANDYVDVR